MSSPLLRAKWWKHRAENFSAALLLSMAVSFLIQIFWRYVLNQPQGWTVEYVAISWLWGILFGYAFVVRDNEIIRLDLLYNAMGPRARAATDILSGSIIAGVLLWSLPASLEFVSFMAVERTAYLQLGYNWVFSIYIPFLLAVVVRTLLSVWRAGLVLIRGAAADEVAP